MPMPPNIPQTLLARLAPEILEFAPAPFALQEELDKLLRVRGVGVLGDGEMHRVFIPRVPQAAVADPGDLAEILFHVVPVDD